MRKTLKLATIATLFTLSLGSAQAADEGSKENPLANASPMGKIMTEMETSCARERGPDGNYVYTNRRDCIDTLNKLQAEMKDQGNQSGVRFVRYYRQSRGL